MSKKENEWSECYFLINIQMLPNSASILFCKLIFLSIHQSDSGQGVNFKIFILIREF